MSLSLWHLIWKRSIILIPFSKKKEIRKLVIFKINNLKKKINPKFTNEVRFLIISSRFINKKQIIKIENY
jgi:hypothetical protein